MKVKINNVWYDSDEQPICIQINASEKECISNLDYKYAPQGKIAFWNTDNLDYTDEQILNWMNNIVKLLPPSKRCILCYNFLLSEKEEQIMLCSNCTPNNK